MNENEDATTSDDELIAYLDGELETDAARRIEQRLADDPDMRRRLNQHQQTWDFLDDLPRVHVDPRFTRTTVELVTVKAAEDLDQQQRRPVQKRVAGWLLTGAVVVLSSWSGFMMIMS